MRSRPARSIIVAAFILAAIVHRVGEVGAQVARLVTTDGTHTVLNTQTLKFTSGCTVTPNGLEADVACSGGGGTVTSITAGTGLTATPANPITGSGTLALTATGITAARYDAVSVNAYGQATSGEKRVYDMLAYGAKGDCSTDDAPIFQNILTVAQGTTPSGGTVLFPPPPGGCYVMSTQSLYLPSASDDNQLEVMGVGGQSEIQIGAAIYWLYANASGTLHVHDLTFRPKSTADANAQNIVAIVAAPSGQKLIIERTIMVGFQSATGGSLILADTPTTVIRDNVIGDSITFGAGAGIIQIGNALNVSIYGNRFSDFWNLDGIFWGSQTGYGSGTAFVQIQSGYTAGNVYFWGNWTDEGQCADVATTNPTGAFENLVVENNFSLVNVTGGCRFVTATGIPNLRVTGNQVEVRSTTEPTIAVSNVTNTVIDQVEFVPSSGGTGNLSADSGCTDVWVKETNFSASQLASSATRTRFSQSGIDSTLATSAAAVVVNTLVKNDSSTDQSVRQLGTSDKASSVIGVAQDAAGGASVNIRVAHTGQIVQVKSDGSSTITRGQSLGVSTTSAGRVLQVATGNQVGVALSSAAASADALVWMLIIPGGVG
jgi:hypothetical protein